MAKKKADVNVFDSLMNSASKPVVSKKTKSSKPIIQCASPSEEQALDSFTSADAVFKVSKASQEVAKSRVYDIFKKRLYELAIDCGYMPDNPGIKSKMSSVNLVAKHMSKIKGVDGDGNPIDFEEKIKEAGFSDEVVENITENIIEEKQVLGMKRFTDLIAEDSSPQEKKVAEKIMQLLHKNLTEDELGLVLEKTTEFTISDNWQDEAVKIACASVDKGHSDYKNKAVSNLEKLFGVISPVFVLSQMEFAGDIDKAFANTKEKIPDSSPLTKMEANGKVYNIETAGNTVTVTSEGFSKSKSCTSPEHVQNTLKKWKRQPETFTEFLK